MDSKMMQPAPTFTAPGSVRSLLQTQIEQLDLPQQKKFSDTLQRLRS